MRLLLDTHTFIWFVIDSPQLSLVAKNLIEDESNEKWLSVASVWEMAIKSSIGKLRFEQPVQVFVEQQMQQNSMDLLPIEMSHLALVETLPLHHRDPFDRLLLAQAKVKDMPIVGLDGVFDAYAVQRLR
jgi:PIN domain nuclease of toxin-antitoxin system